MAGPPLEEPAEGVEKETIFHGSLAYDSLTQNAVASNFTVKNRTKEIAITVYVNATQPEAYLVLGFQYYDDPIIMFRSQRKCTGADGPACGQPQIVFMPFQEQYGKADQAQQALVGAQQQTLSQPYEGLWQFAIAGNGRNAYVEATVVAFYFAED